jgi:hypothetical protein
VVIDAAPEAVFDSMTQPEQYRRGSGVHVDIEPYVGGRFAMGGFDLDPGGMQVRRVRAGPQGDAAVRRRLTVQLGARRVGGQDPAHLVQSGFDPTNPPYPGWAGWLAGVAELRRYHELPRWRRSGADRGRRCPHGDVRERLTSERPGTRSGALVGGFIPLST